MAPRKRARKIKTEGPRRGRQDDVEGMRKSESRSGTEENDEDWKPEKVSIKAVRKRARKQASDAVVKAGEDNGVGEAAKVVPNVDTKPSPKKRRVTKERLSNQIGTSLVAKLDDAQRMAGQQANPFTKANKVEEQGAGYGMHHFESNDMDMISLSGSEDEWEEMEEVEPPAGPIVEVTIRQPKQEESEESKWAKFIRQEVNRQINKRKVNCHKMHLLCYIAHLRQWMRCLVRSEYLSAQCLSLIPVGYVSAAELTFDVALAERFLKWFKSAFTPAKKFYEARSGFSDAQAERLGRLISEKVYETDKDIASAERLGRLISEKVYETDKDIASILLLCVFALKQSVRLCLSCQPVPHKPASNLHSLVKSIKLNEENETETRLAEIDERRVSNAKKTTLKATKRTKWNSCGNSGHSVDGKCSPENIEHGQRGRKKKKADANSRKETPEPKKKKSTPNIRPERNYWVEYWDEVSERWICM
ncbi:DNA repair protein complementing XP-C cells -like protein [Toxocara canis]|uniref:DNA repair protein complementing XP-C cells-like protein n=1 Tax=Toxocara canis TaxID=6265 RepID=A0A0B2VYM6_TOXCA|nr:DNA repair protein complementing XP-C cells -like protein [Toxocara canis]